MHHRRCIITKEKRLAKDEKLDSKENEYGDGGLTLLVQQNAIVWHVLQRFGVNVMALCFQRNEHIYLKRFIYSIL